MSRSFGASLGQSNPPQSRIEANFVNFAEELHLKFVMASFHDDDSVQFSLFSTLVLYYCTFCLPEHNC